MSAGGVGAEVTPVSTKHADTPEIWRLVITMFSYYDLHHYVASIFKHSAVRTQRWKAGPPTWFEKESRQQRFLDPVRRGAPHRHPRVLSDRWKWETFVSGDFLTPDQRKDPLRWNYPHLSSVTYRWTLENTLLYHQGLRAWTLAVFQLSAQLYKPELRDDYGKDRLRSFLTAWYKWSKKSFRSVEKLEWWWAVERSR